MTLLDGLLNFFMYFGVALALFALFIGAYLRLTPYAEMKLIREGNVAAAYALVGAIVGFVLPLASCIAQSLSVRDMAIWGALAMVIQALVYLLMSRLLPELNAGIAEGKQAHGILLGGLAFAIGLINAACMIY